MRLLKPTVVVLLYVPTLLGLVVTTVWLFSHSNKDCWGVVLQEGTYRMTETTVLGPGPPGNTTLNVGIGTAITKGKL